MLVRISLLAMAAAPVLSFSGFHAALRVSSFHRSHLQHDQRSNLRVPASPRAPAKHARGRFVCALADSEHDEMKFGARLQVDDIDALRTWVEVIDILVMTDANEHSG